MKYWRLLIGLMYLSASLPAWPQVFPSTAGPVKVSTVAKGLEHPWGLAFLPDNRMLVTERPGRMRIVSQDGQVSAPLLGLPPVYAQGQGGLLDVILDPDFTRNQILYFCFAEEKNGKAGTAVAKAELGEKSLANVSIIFRQNPKVEGENHWGCRLVFDNKGELFVTLGERFNYSQQAQNLSTHLGKIVRLTTSGKPAPDNPFIGQTAALPEIWSFGHRNIQGAAINPQTGDLWAVEHGPRGGDELNIIAPGKNYGWPEASYGSHYSFLPIPDEHARQGFVEPLYYWNPSISPSGMLFYTADKFPTWKGDLFTGALNGRALIHLHLEKGKVVEEERLLKDLKERIRDVRQGKDGFIYLLTDNAQGRILRLELTH